ncbi:MAG: UDP-N-acetylmuramoyl-L-alanine--D-glutamate ligase [Pseudomonadota bacterium]
MTMLRGQFVLVLGLGETGLSLARWATAQGARVRVADSRSNPPGLDVLRRDCPQAEIRCGAFEESLLADIDRIALSPGVSIDEPLVRQAQARGLPVEGDVEWLAHTFPAESRPKVIAITGANGKTTVTSMVGAMCRAAGLDTAVAGNISPAVLDALMARGGKQPEVWVLELSSFQLESTDTLHPDASTVLNISEDHLDRHGSMDAYAAAKARIFAGSGVQVLNRDDARSLSMALPGRSVVTFGLNAPANRTDWGVVYDGDIPWLAQDGHRILRADALHVAGLHNVANALAALALCRALDLPLKPLCQALQAFKGLPHRVERVAEIRGVTYYDDSKGTNVGATEAALKGLGKRAVVILGGDGKGQDFTPLRAAVTQHARAAVLIGRDAEKIAAVLEGCGVPVLFAPNMDEAARWASQAAEPGDAVLMSPACASFDMYRNYLHRAEAFRSAVAALQEEATC